MGAQPDDGVLGIVSWLTGHQLCLTLSYMKTTSLTIRLEKELERMLDKASRQSGKSRSTLAREALARHLRLVQFEVLRKKTMPFAEARGYLSDEDLFREIS